MNHEDIVFIESSERSILLDIKYNNITIFREKTLLMATVVCVLIRVVGMDASTKECSHAISVWLFYIFFGTLFTDRRKINPAAGCHILLSDGTEKQSLQWTVCRPRIRIQFQRLDFLFLAWYNALRKHPLSIVHTPST